MVLRPEPTGPIRSGFHSPHVSRLGPDGRTNRGDRPPPHTRARPARPHAGYRPRTSAPTIGQPNPASGPAAARARLDAGLLP